MKNNDISKIWHNRKLHKSESSKEEIEAFVEEFSEINFYVEQPNRHGLKYVHVVGEDENRTDLGDDLIMVENKDQISFYSEKTRIQSRYWIMKRRPGCFELQWGFAPPLYLGEYEEVQSAVGEIMTRIRGKYKMTMKEYMGYQGTEKAPFVVDTPFDPAEFGNKTPFGSRVGGDIITLKHEHLEALKNGQYVAIDVEREYVAFLKLDEGENNGLQTAE